jgi:hypothetical protein
MTAAPSFIALPARSNNRLLQYVYIPWYLPTYIHPRIYLPIRYVPITYTVLRKSRMHSPQIPLEVYHYMILPINQKSKPD